MGTATGESEDAPRAATPLTAALGQYLDHLTVERGLARNSLASYRRDLARYQEFLTEVGVHAPDEVTEGHVLAFLGRLREGDPVHQPLAALLQPLAPW